MLVPCWQPKVVQFWLFVQYTVNEPPEARLLGNVQTLKQPLTSLMLRLVSTTPLALVFSTVSLKITVCG